MNYEPGDMDIEDMDTEEMALAMEEGEWEYGWDFEPVISEQELHDIEDLEWAGVDYRHFRDIAPEAETYDPWEVALGD